MNVIQLLSIDLFLSIEYMFNNVRSAFLVEEILRYNYNV